MISSRLFLAFLVTTFLLPSCSNLPKSADTRVPAGTVISPAREFNSSDLEKISSTKDLVLGPARVIIDNDAAFLSKRDALRTAQRGDTIRLVYYIYSDDYSSSHFSQELLQAAKRGVKIKLLVEYLTNFKLLDLFSYLEREGQGNLKVRFYNKPSDLVLRDMRFMSSPCPDAAGKPEPTQCSNYKWKTLQTSSPDIFADLLHVGIYSRDAAAIKTAIFMGQMIDLSKYKGAGGTAEERKQLNEFFKLIFDCKIKNDINGCIKAQMALLMYGNELNPVLNEVYGHIPLDQMGQTSGKDWEHVTDFTHHKLLLIEDRFFQLGGRNIEDSYHMKPNQYTKKYIFMDTDFAAQIQKNGNQIVRAFDDLWNFSPMTVDLSAITAKSFAVDFVNNDAAANATLVKCAPKIYKTVEHRSDFAACLTKNLPLAPGYRNLNQRLQDVGLQMQSNEDTYLAKYKPSIEETWKSTAKDDHVESEDLQNMVTAYIEGLHFDRRLEPAKRTRLFGALTGKEAKYGKNIHAAWARGLENTCYEAAAELRKDPNAKEKRIILHSAYFIPPPTLLRAFGKMIDGTWDCRNVRVTFLTNSFATTDLNYINVFARYEMMAFFHIYATRQGHFGDYEASKGAKFEYYEYKKSTVASGLSLHTKLSVFGDDLIIGSANADARSYYMDTNNGVYLMGARNLAREYSNWIEQIIKDPTKTTNLTAEYMSSNISVERLNAEDKLMIDQLMSRWKIKPELRATAKDKIIALSVGLGSKVVEYTQKILSKQYIEAYGESDNETDQKKFMEQLEIEAAMNRMLQVL